MNESGFARLVEGAGGGAYIAGGWVRDTLRDEIPHDKDYVVTGLTEETFLSLFPGARMVGRGFPVYLLEMGGDVCEVAFARRDVKTGKGYRGFTVSFDPDISIEDDLSRRDTTINSMAIRLLTGDMTDPFGGGLDIERRVIKATSERFTEDPVRALRAARQSAQFGFEIDRGTMLMMGECRDELSSEPRERITNELARALAADRPSLFFRALADAGILDATYPQIHALRKAAFEHAMRALDKASRETDRIEIRFAALARGTGRSPASLEALEAWRRIMPLPKRWTDCAEFAMREHMRACSLTKPEEITDLLLRVRRHPIGIDGFAAIIRADFRGTPDYIENAEKYYGAMDAIRGDAIPDGLEGSARGAWLRERRIASVARVLAEASAPISICRL
ncbi:MAG: hypothetical protein LBT23_06830 [Synergistaceae bacterium]|nr:hypothetical protein [Synergistaceae bacterium]